MSATKPHIPTAIREVTSEWLGAVLAAGGVDGDVATIEVSPVGTGQMASSVRADITYNDRFDTAPPSVVVKLASDDATSRAAGARGAYEREVRYYQLLDETVDVSTPICLWADIDTDSNDFVVVLQDMRPAEQGDQIRGCLPEHAIQATRNIAGLHAPRWGDPSLRDYAWLTPPPEQRAQIVHETQALTATLTEGFIERYASTVSSQVADLLRRFAKNLPQWLQVGGDQFALTHADHRLDNLLFGDDPTQPVTVVDWQTIGVRNPLADVAYLLGTGLKTPVRREVEQEIVDDYHQCLVDRGVVDYSAERCFLDYRRQTLHALLITVLGSMMTVRTDRGDKMFMAMLDRSTSQIFDLDADQFC